MSRHDDRDRKGQPSFGNDALKSALQKVKQDLSAEKQAANQRAEAEKRAQQQRRSHHPPPPPGRSKAKGIPDDSDGDALFLAVMDDVAPVKKVERAPEPPNAAELRRARVEDDAEALAKLAELVADAEKLEVTGAGAKVSGCARGVDSGLVEALVEGRFRTAASLDLAKAATREAETKTSQFLLDSRRSGHRCVALQGVGPEGADAIARWVAGPRLARVVLAFAAVKTDVRVLLRR